MTGILDDQREALFAAKVSDYAAKVAGEARRPGEFTRAMANGALMNSADVLRMQDIGFSKGFIGSPLLNPSAVQKISGMGFDDNTSGAAFRETTDPIYDAVAREASETNDQVNAILAEQRQLQARLKEVEARAAKLLARQKYLNSWLKMTPRNEKLD